MLNIDLEPLKKLYEDIIKTQALSEKELQELKELIKTLQETKEEFENSSFGILQKNQELFDKSTNILQNTEKMSTKLLQNINEISNKLLNLEEKLEEEKVNFDKEIKQKFDSLLNNLKFSLSSLSIQTLNEKRKIEKELENFKENVENNLKNVKKTIVKEENELDEVRKQYEKKLENYLNSFKRKIDEYDEEIEEKTFFQKWGAVFIAFVIGAIITIAIILYFFENDIIFSFKYSNTCLDSDNNLTYKCYVVPAKKVGLDKTNQYFLIDKN